MRSVKEHYDKLLGPVYSWIVGDFETAYEANAALFERLELSPAANGVAVDLGCGPGCQAIPLAERGFQVIAMDFCESLLQELQQRAGTAAIQPVCDDILNVGNHAGTAELVVCMGDTLVHLPSRDAVIGLLGEVADILSPGGRFIATLRDYTTSPPTGAARFIPVRSSDEQIFTCFLDYRGDTIDVHDLLYTRENGSWRLEISNYQKLALDYRWIADRLRDCGLTVAESTVSGGMVLLDARKPA